MKATEILRAFLDILDRAEQIEPQVTVTNINMDDPSAGDRRMQAIQDLLPTDDCGCAPANAPQEKYADIDAVTTLAGGGMHEPKEPEDIRGEHGSMFRDYLARVQRGE